MKGIFRRIGMTLVAAGNSGRDALLSVHDGQRCLAELGPDVRSQKSHNHQFGEVADYWEHLPEHMAAELPTPEHLRKYALCAGGFCEIEKFVFGTPADAAQAALCAKPRSKRGEDYCVIDVADRVVTRYTPLSQSRAAMGGKDFEASKQAVLEVCARLCGGDLEQLRRSPSIVPERERETERV